MIPIDNYTELVTGRKTALFTADVIQSRAQLESRIKGRRILVIGGAGSIGASTVRAIVPFQPGVLHVVDQNENGLAELVRDLRCEGQISGDVDFKTLPLDFGSEIMHRWLLSEAPYDYVLNFAAIKHVRSEKDVYCVLQMLDTNVLKPLRLLQWLDQKGGTERYFCVSTDKAANPVSLMGASKRIMEHTIFSGEIEGRSLIPTTSARFANVAFSEGSLLQSWLIRLGKQQPLVAPRETKRYFISLGEAAQICLLAAFQIEDRHLLIPDFDPRDDLKDLAELGAAVLRKSNYEPSFYDDEDEARNKLPDELAKGRYPLLLTPLNTSGEKPYEEFVSKGETTVSVNLPNLEAIPYAGVQPGLLVPFLEKLNACISDPDESVEKGELIEMISRMIPEFKHISGNKLLDNRM